MAVAMAAADPGGEDSEGTRFPFRTSRSAPGQSVLGSVEPPDRVLTEQSRVANLRTYGVAVLEGGRPWKLWGPLRCMRQSAWSWRP